MSDDWRDRCATALEDFSAAAKACPECERWRARKHPIQGPYCDDHHRALRRIYADRDAAEEREWEAQRIERARQEGRDESAATIASLRTEVERLRGVEWCAREAVEAHRNDWEVGRAIAALADALDEVQS